MKKEITIEQIDNVKNRANVGYKEAKETLEQFDGDVIESILYLEDKNKLKINKITNNITIVDSEIWDKCKEAIEKLNNIKIVISKDDKIALRLPSTVAIVAGIIGMPVVIVGLVLSVFTGHKIRFENDNGSFSEINDKMDIVTGKAHDFTKKL